AVASRGSLDAPRMGGKRGQRTVDVRAGRACHEDDVRVARVELVSGVTAGRVDQDRAPVFRLGRHEGAVQLPRRLPREGIILGLRPQPLQYLDELTREFVAPVMLDLLPSEHFMLNGTMPGHNVDTPAAPGYVVKGCAEFR